MSVKMMGLVYDAHLPPGENSILLAYADHANHEGEEIYPGYTRIANKTGYSRRQVIRIAAQLQTSRKAVGKFAERRELLIAYGTSKRGTTKFKLNIPELKALDPNFTGDTMSPVEENASDTMSPVENQVVTPSHPPSDTMSPEPSFNRPLNPDEKILEEVKRTLKSEMPLAEYNRRIKPLFFFENGKANGTIAYAQNDEYTTDWLSQRLTTRVNQIIRGAYDNAELSVIFQTAPNPTKE